MIEHVARVDDTVHNDELVPVWMLNQRIDQINRAIDQTNFYVNCLYDLPTADTP